MSSIYVIHLLIELVEISKFMLKYTLQKNVSLVVIALFIGISVFPSTGDVFIDYSSEDVGLSNLNIFSPITKLYQGI